MEKIVFATNNLHKLEEVRNIVGERMQILSLSDIGCTDDIPETADTIERASDTVQSSAWKPRVFSGLP